ncbi:HET-domain-containing protein [Stipitochalara longipes BDJ]|nr:HET-domain-containing protein [Stipitochalara longipes BDJ]
MASRPLENADVHDEQPFPPSSHLPLHDSGQAHSTIAEEMISKPMTKSHTEKRKLDNISTDELPVDEFPQREEAICEDCSKIDFGKVRNLNATSLQRKNTGAQGILVSTLGARIFPPKGAACALCRVFSASCIAPTSPSPHSSQGYELRAYSFLKYSRYTSLHHCSKDLKSRDQPFLAVVPENAGDEVHDQTRRVGLLFDSSSKNNQSKIFTPRIVPPLLHYSILKEWLDYCKTHHKVICGLEGDQSLNLKLIDCTSLSIVSPSELPPYAALSYVWGHNGISTYTKGRNIILGSLPNVITDAIVVTKELGLNFLWVDKLCIDQDNPDTKHDQISHMDFIYRSAEITFVAAAGEDENTGLPGVGTRVRRTQPVAQFGDMKIISSMSHPFHTITNSRWWTRGWTYQEAVLSRRCLVFTEDQVYFKYYAMNCFESIQNNLDLTHVKNKSKSLQFMHSGIFSGKRKQAFAAVDLEKSAVGNLVRYLEHVHQYSSKNLSFEEDALEAFAGITSYLQRARDPIFQVWGVPFWYPRGRAAVEVCKSIIVGLLWRHIRDLDPTSEKPYRRPGFPSWSWAGWVGQIEFLVPVSYPMFESKVIGVHLEYEPGNLVKLNNVFSNPSRTMSDLSTPAALHLDTLIASLPSITVGNSLHPSAWNIAGFNAIANLSQSPHDQKAISELFLSKTWELILCGTEAFHWYTEKPGISFIIIENHKDHASRIGTVVVECGNLDKFRKIIKMEKRRVRLL